MSESQARLTKLDRARGALMGLAVGDALGTTLEFRSPGSFEPITDMVGGGPFRLEPGQWTDDTSMALCLAQSIIARKGFDPADQMERYVRWWKEGYMSSNDRCFDIGNTVAKALRNFLQSNEPLAGCAEEYSAGNGCIMRLAPVALAWSKGPRDAIAHAGESSRTTHGHPLCIDACRYLSALLCGAIQGETKSTLLSARYAPRGYEWEESPLAPRIDAIARGSFAEKEPPEIRGSGFVVDCLEAALWAFHKSDNFREGALLAVNLGDDADTTGAVYGQIAGAYYGFSGIPEEWRGLIAHREMIIELADALHTMAWGENTETEVMPFATRRRTRNDLPGLRTDFD